MAGMGRSGMALMLVAMAAGVYAEAPEAFELSGTVRTADGGGLAGFVVVLPYTIDGQAAGELKAATDAKGHYALFMPVEVRWNTLRVDAPDGSNLRLAEVTPEESFHEASLRLKARSRLDLIMREASSGIAGTVTCAAGPVAGAKVTILRNGVAPMGSISLEAVTDAAGRYAIANQLPGDYCIQSVIPPPGLGLMGVHVGWPRMYPYERAATRLEAGRVAGGSVYLNAGCRMSGRVVDEKGRAVEGATVTARRGSASVTPDNGYANWKNYGDTTTTDKSGRYLLGGLSPETYELAATPAEGTALAPSHPIIGLVVEKDFNCPDIVLVRAGSIEGVVRTPAGAAVAGVELKLGERKTVTDREGRYVFGGLASDGTDLMLTPPEGTPWAVQTVKGVATLAKTRLRYDWTLHEGVTIVGTVTDEKGEAVSGATVIGRCGHRNGKPFVATTKTDAKGAYRIQGLTGSQHMRDESISNHFTLGVYPPGESLCVGQKVSIGARLGEKITRDFALARGGTVHGRVTDETGRPVAGAWVKISMKRPNQWEVVTTCFGPGEHPDEGYSTDSDGYFRVGQVAAEKVSIAVRPPEWRNLMGTVLKDVEAAAGGVTETKVELKIAGMIAGVVRHGRDGALEGAMVEVSHFDKEAADYGVRLMPVTTGEDGRFSFSRLSSGRYLIVTKPLGRYVAVPQVVEVTEGREAKVDARVFDPAFIEVSVADGEGRPVKGVSMTAENPTQVFPALWNGQYIGKTDEKGQARIGPLEPGEYRVTAGDPRSGEMRLKERVSTEAKVREGDVAKAAIKVEVER